MLAGVYALRAADLSRLLGVLRHRDRLGATCSASRCPRTSARRIAARTSRSSGGAGTSALSTWLRDYLYIALGGSRGAQWRTYLQPRSLTMLLGGLWHGASWAFIVWGGAARLRPRDHALLPARDGDRRATRRSRAVRACVAIAAVGSRSSAARSSRDDIGTWTQLVFAWLYLTPLWAVLTGVARRASRRNARRAAGTAAVARARSRRVDPPKRCGSRMCASARARSSRALECGRAVDVDPARCR